jgi:hypothetical protein
MAWRRVGVRSEWMEKERVGGEKKAGKEWRDETGARA